MNGDMPQTNDAFRTWIGGEIKEINKALNVTATHIIHLRNSCQEQWGKIDQHAIDLAVNKEKLANHQGRISILENKYVKVAAALICVAAGGGGVVKLLEVLF